MGRENVARTIIPYEINRYTGQAENILFLRLTFTPRVGGGENIHIMTSFPQSVGEGSDRCGHAVELWEIGVGKNTDIHKKPPVGFPERKEKTLHLDRFIVLLLQCV